MESGAISDVITQGVLALLVLKEVFSFLLPILKGRENGNGKVNGKGNGYAKEADLKEGLRIAQSNREMIQSLSQKQEANYNMTLESLRQLREIIKEFTKSTSDVLKENTQSVDRLISKIDSYLSKEKI